MSKAFREKWGAQHFFLLVRVLTTGICVLSLTFSTSALYSRSSVAKHGTTQSKVTEPEVAQQVVELHERLKGFPFMPERTYLGLYASQLLVSKASWSPNSNEMNRRNEKLLELSDSLAAMQVLTRFIETSDRLLEEFKKIRRTEVGGENSRLALTRDQMLDTLRKIYQAGDETTLLKALKVCRTAKQERESIASELSSWSETLRISRDVAPIMLDRAASHHDPSSSGFRGRGTTTSISPDKDVVQKLWISSVPSAAKGAPSLWSWDGKHFHRFMGSQQGDSILLHWNGDSNSKSNPERSFAEKDLPPHVKNHFSRVKEPNYPEIKNKAPVVVGIEQTPAVLLEAFLTRSLKESQDVNSHENLPAAPQQLTSENWNRKKSTDIQILNQLLTLTHDEHLSPSLLRKLVTSANSMSLEDLSASEGVTYFQILNTLEREKFRLPKLNRMKERAFKIMEKRPEIYQSLLSLSASSAPANRIWATKALRNFHKNFQMIDLSDAHQDSYILHSLANRDSEHFQVEDHPETLAYLLESSKERGHSPQVKSALISAFFDQFTDSSAKIAGDFERPILSSRRLREIFHEARRVFPRRKRELIAQEKTEQRAVYNPKAHSPSTPKVSLERFWTSELLNRADPRVAISVIRKLQPENALALRKSFDWPTTPEFVETLLQTLLDQSSLLDNESAESTSKLGAFLSRLRMTSTELGESEWKDPDSSWQLSMDTQAILNSRSEKFKGESPLEIQSRVLAQYFHQLHLAKGELSASQASSLFIYMKRLRDVRIGLSHMQAFVTAARPLLKKLPTAELLSWFDTDSINHRFDADLADDLEARNSLSEEVVKNLSQIRKRLQPYEAVTWEREYWLKVLGTPESLKDWDSNPDSARRLTALSFIPDLLIQNITSYLEYGAGPEGMLNHPKASMVSREQDTFYDSIETRRDVVLGALRVLENKETLPDAILERVIKLISDPDPEVSFYAADTLLDRKQIPITWKAALQESLKKRTVRTFDSRLLPDFINELGGAENLDLLLRKESTELLLLFPSCLRESL